MKIDLDKIEQTAKAAKEFHAESKLLYWSTWFEDIGHGAQALAETCSPDVVLAMVERIRELEAGLIEAADIACVQMTQEDYYRMGELEALARKR